MNKKLVLSIAFTILLTAVGFSQKIKLKKGKVLVDGKAIMKYERQGLGAKITLYSLDNDDEIIDMLAKGNETPHCRGDDYCMMFFSEDEIKVETSQFNGMSWKRVIKQIIRSKVLDMDGNINSEKLKKFARKYDENITNRTVRY